MGDSDFVSGSAFGSFGGSAMGVVLAAGVGSRYGGDKVWELMEGEPVWLRAGRGLWGSGVLTGVGFVVSAGRLDEARGWVAGLDWVRFVVAGGGSRGESSRAGVEAAAADFVLVHDGARPWVSGDLVRRVLERAREVGAVFPAMVATDTLREVGEGGAYRALERGRVLSAQTPQGGRRDWLVDALGRAGGLEATDEAGALLAAGYEVDWVEGEAGNRKVTFAGDLARLDMAGGEVVREMEYRTGFGYDIHRFSEDLEREMWLGGVEFTEGRPGLAGHSDADALLHAVVDALLGAAGLGDIGVHYPPSEERWRGVRSVVFLEGAARLLSEAGWEVVSVDATVVAERPKVMGRAGEIRAVVGGALGIGSDRVSVKATTNEGLGSIGRLEGIAAYAVASIRRR